jgi:hypothetical protein
MFDYRTCFLCKRTETTFNRLEVHHIFQNANRKKSDEYGLTVLLCADCHRLGEYSAHRNAEVADYLHKYGQRKAMLEQGWSKEDFMKIFGANYLDEEN